jgi:hypothetical protein
MKRSASGTRNSDRDDSAVVGYGRIAASGMSHRSVGDEFAAI